MSKFTGNQRVSALKRLSSASNPHGSQASGSGSAIRDARQLLSRKTSSSFDARQLLSRKNSSPFDARQLLSRPKAEQTTSNVAVRNRILPAKPGANAAMNQSDKMVVVTGLKDMKIQGGKLISNPFANKTEEEKKKQIFAVGSSTFVTIRNPTNSNLPTEKTSLTKTIKNPTATPSQTPKNPFSSNEKFIVSFPNDNYRNEAAPVENFSSALQEFLSMAKRLDYASIPTARPATTAASVASRAPVRTNSQQRAAASSAVQTKKRALSDDEDNESDHLDLSHDEFYEPPLKRASVAVRKASKDEEQEVTSSSTKRISTASSISSRLTSNKTKPVITNTGIVLVTNLQSSVTQEDVQELFEQCGQIVEITTLSQGCVQIIYGKREYAEQAVADYHNRLLDGQLMYVSLQQNNGNKKKQNLNR